MKKGILLLITVLLLFSLSIPSVLSDSINEDLEQFKETYESLKPGPNSSVHTDYKLDQTALGTFYTTKTLGYLYKQNQVLLNKYDQMLDKYDTIIQQNNKIIQLLSKDLERRRPAMKHE